jgi:hypothetical protein
MLLAGRGMMENYCFMGTEFLWEMIFFKVLEMDNGNGWITL